MYGYEATQLAKKVGLALNIETLIMSGRMIYLVFFFGSTRPPVAAYPA